MEFGSIQLLFSITVAFTPAFLTLSSCPANTPPTIAIASVETVFISTSNFKGSKSTFKFALLINELSKVSFAESESSNLKLAPSSAVQVPEEYVALPPLNFVLPAADHNSDPSQAVVPSPINTALLAPVSSALNDNTAPSPFNVVVPSSVWYIYPAVFTLCCCACGSFPFSLFPVLDDTAAPPLISTLSVYSPCS